MTKTSMSPAELLEKYDEGDFLRAVAEAVLQLLMETDGVPRGQHTVVAAAIRQAFSQPDRERT